MNVNHNGEHFMARMPNWLPLPGVDEGPLAGEACVVDEDDLFSKAIVETFYPRQGFGYIVSDDGRRIRFDLAMVSLVGPRAGAGAIKEGMRVGFDIAHASKEPLVSTIRIY